MHQDIEDSLASSSISHAGGPQSPARSTENLLNGHRNKGLLDLGRREESSEASSSSVFPSQMTLTQNSLKPSTTAPPASASASAKQRPCLFRVEEDEEEEEEHEPSPLPTQVILRRKPPSVTNRLTSRKSAPVLNQIFEEEGESDDDDFNMDESLPPKLSRLKMNMASPGTAQKRYHRRKSQGRGSSCSSSETSDDDSESHRRRLDKESGFTYSWHRRDSSEGPPGNSGGNGGGGSSGGQSKPPGEGNSGPDRGSSNGGSGGSGNTGEGGGSKGQGSPSNCSSGSSNPASGSTRTAARSTGELMESLKLMSLCLSSQLQHRRSGGGGGGRFIMDPQSLSSVRVQEKSSWKMCIGSNSNLEKTLNVGGRLTDRYPDQAAAVLNELALAKENNLNLKANVLQLPLCEKTISVNIQRSPRDGLLCTSAQASCCQVI